MRVEPRPLPPALPDDPNSRHVRRAPPRQVAAPTDAHARAVVAFATANAVPGRNAMQSRLDAFRASASGPYHAEGQTVRAPAQFRMVHGYNQSRSDAHRTTPDPQENLFSVLARAHLEPWRAAASSGRAAASDVVKVTQALIDAGKLEPGPRPLAERIRKMQWEWGVGLDCAGYAQQALLAAHPTASAATLGLKERWNENLSSLDRNPAFARVGPQASRPGDVVTLENPGDVGHIGIVWSRAPVDAARVRSLAGQMGREAASFLAGAGPFHELVIDSSWGAGESGAWYGGVRQETWLYDEGSKRWACWRPLLETTETHRLEVSEGPCGEKLQGFYRPRTD